MRTCMWAVKMKEEYLGILNVRHLILGEHDVIKSCTLFLTRNRIIVVSTEGVNRWIFVSVAVAFAASFMGMLFRNIVLLLAGLVAWMIAVLLVGLVNFVIRQRKIGEMKRLNPRRILEMNEKNFEISYAKIVKVVVITFKTYPGVNYLFPSFQENRYKIDFITCAKKHSFILDRGKLQKCLNLIQQFVPETIEINQA